MRSAAVVTVAVVLVGASFGSSGAEPLAGSPKPAVASLNLSRSNLYEEIEVVNGKLVLSGGPDGSPFPSASGAASPNSPASEHCHSAVVDPVSLALSDQRAGNCDDPSLYGVRAMVINEFINGNKNGGHIRISHVAATASGFALGPVVMTYTELSDTDAEWIYGDGYLWIFDPVTTHGSELLRASETTGAVLQTARMPWVDRPLLAADSDGLWIAPAGNSGFEPISATGLYHLAPGMTRPTRVRQFKWSAYWMVAAGHSVLIDINRGGKSTTLWRLDGPAGKPVLQVSSKRSLGFGEFGYGQPTVTGNAADGIWTVLPQLPEYPQQRVVRIDPDTGHASTLASITPPGNYNQPYNSPPVVVLDGSLFFLDPPTISYPGGTTGAVVHGPSLLYRVTPR